MLVEANNLGDLIRAEVMRSCPNLWVELSARDPWRYVNNPITDAAGVLLPDWRTLIESFPDRFMVGSDPVWPVEHLDRWDQPDSGWKHYGRFVRFHRHWLRQLAPSIADKVRRQNARALFGKARQAPPAGSRGRDSRKRTTVEEQSPDLSYGTRERGNSSECGRSC